MTPFTVWEGVAAPIDKSKVDTDQILPARYLRLLPSAVPIVREGFFHRHSIRVLP